MSLTNEQKRAYLFQIKTEYQGNEFTTLSLIRARRQELKSLLNDYMSKLYDQPGVYENTGEIELYKFNNGDIKVKLGNVGMVTDPLADWMIKSCLVNEVKSSVKDGISSFNIRSPKSKLHTRNALENRKKGEGLVSGRLYIKTFATCIRCSTSVINGKPMPIQQSWNSAHLYNAIESEEQSFKNVNSVPMFEPINISWAVPATDEVIKGEGHCEFCHTLCPTSRTKVCMVIIM